MLLKPKYLRAVGATYVTLLVYLSIISLLNLYRGDAIDPQDWAVFLLIGGPFLSVGVCVMFTPRELYYDEDGFAIKAIFPGSGTYTWDQLEAYSWWSGGTFLLKFEGKQAFQIVPYAFTRAEWKDFIQFLRSRFPRKRTAVWLGPIPMRFRK